MNLGGDEAGGDHAICGTWHPVLDDDVTHLAWSGIRARSPVQGQFVSIDFTVD
ncbi:hypothetical protein [Actinoplanes sp. NPDC049118]|uniref:hypothetical protein n=1 Tax=Actinoplanes sp. NPDC049118 TaxID=3155769 RepID=UPI0033EE23AE